jgi:radical SAM superfamily enzyme YgiQ (UPF0313 family)
MYRDKKYRVRSFDEIVEDIELAWYHKGDQEKVFLCDGDAIEIDTELLLKILKELYKSFPSLKQVSTYVGPKSTLRKSMSELIALKNAGLKKAYLGVESGDDRVLKEMNKGVTADEMLTAGKNLIEAGWTLSAMMMLGLAGSGDPSREHAQKTAEMINQMKPDYLAAMTTTPVEGTPLFRKIQKGEFQPLNDIETLQELKILFENITIDDLQFVGTHVSNIYPISGTLQKDKQKMLDLADGVIDMISKSPTVRQRPTMF